MALSVVKGAGVEDISLVRSTSIILIIFFGIKCFRAQSPNPSGWVRHVFEFWDRKESRHYQKMMKNIHGLSCVLSCGSFISKIRELKPSVKWESFGCPFIFSPADSRLHTIKWCEVGRRRIGLENCVVLPASAWNQRHLLVAAGQKSV